VHNHAQALVALYVLILMEVGTQRKILHCNFTAHCEVGP